MTENLQTSISSVDLQSGSNSAGIRLLSERLSRSLLSFGLLFVISQLCLMFCNRHRDVFAALRVRELAKPHHRVLKL